MNDPETALRFDFGPVFTLRTTTPLGVHQSEEGRNMQGRCPPMAATQTRPLFLGFLLVPLFLSVPGCYLGHQRETIVAAFPPGRDEVRLLLVYEGFHANTGGNENLETVLQSAKQELGGLMASEQEFRLDGWPLHFSLAPRQDESEENKEVREFLRTHLRIRKGAFFSDEKHRLNGYQFVTIRDAQKFVAGINDRLSAHLAREIPETLAKPAAAWEPFDNASLEMILKASREKHRWLELKPGRVSFTLPGTQALFERGKREALQLPELAKLLQEATNGKQAGEAAASIALRESIRKMNRDTKWLTQLPLSFELRKGRMTVSLGFGDGEPIVVKTQDESGENRRFEKE